MELVLSLLSISQSKRLKRPFFPMALTRHKTMAPVAPLHRLLMSLLLRQQTMAMHQTVMALHCLVMVPDTVLAISIWVVA